MAAQGFGFGGAMGMAFFPDLASVNAFLSENDLGAMDLLYGGGGSGRGGIIGGPTFGGAGWGLVAESSSELRSAELVLGGGGFDMGYAVGGDDSSVLSVGSVLGGGAVVLTVTDLIFEPSANQPFGLEPTPTSREIGRAIGFVQPYVSLCAELLPWMGFELRIGYLFPLFGVSFGELVGVPLPSLDLSGWTVSLGIVFGGIGGSDDRSGRATRRCEREVTAVSDGTLLIDPVQELRVVNGIGDIVVTSIAADRTQTGSMRTVSWQALRTASEDQIDDVQVVVEPDEYGVTLRTVGVGRVDYTLAVPAGTDLAIRNHTGTVSIDSYEALTVVVENGVGDVLLRRIEAEALIVANGVGSVDLDGIDVGTLVVDVGVGDVRVSLPGTASARVAATASLGDVSIDRFPGMTGGVAGFIGKTGEVVLGMGEDSMDLHVSIGQIDVTMVEP